MKKIFLLFTFHVSLLTFHLNAQVTQEWVQQFSWGNFAQGLSVKLDSTGNVYVLLQTATDSTLGDYGLIKYSNSGNLLWDTTYNSPGNLSDQPTAFAVSGSGDVYILGSTSFNFNQYSLIVKFNSNGMLQWAKTYNDIGGFSHSGICLDRNGNIILVGGDTSSALIVKYNSSGDTLWQRRFPAPMYSNFLSSVAVDDSNNIYAVGVYEDIYDLVLKYNQSGSFQWYNTYRESEQYYGSADYLALDNNRNVYFVGSTVIPGYGFNNDLVKVSSSGMIQWARTFYGVGGSNYHCGPPAGISVTDNGSAVYYTTYVATPTTTDFATLKYNSTGDSEWVRRYPTGIFGGPQWDPAGIKVDKYNNVYITGFANYPSTGINYVTIKYFPNGIQQWVAIYTDYQGGARDLYVDANLNVYVTGTTYTTPQKSTTIKYSQPIGIISNSNELPKEYKLFQNFPNPFNSTTIISYQLPRKSNVILNIYNPTGQLVKTLVNSEQSAGFYSIDVDMENFSSGVYFYTLWADNSLIAAKKFILIK